MKKLLYSFAVFAFALSFTACDNKTGSSAETADSTQDSATAEAPTRDFENDFFTLTAPEGWEVSKRGSDAVRMEDVNSKETFKPVITVRFQENKTLKEKMDYLTQSGSTKKGADYKAGEFTFTTARNEQSELYYCVTEVKGGLLNVETAYVSPEKMEVLAPVIESLKMK